MTWHVTARLAWHDNGWDGRVCKDPAANTYCSGSHSLLSERLAREKKVDCETACAALDSTLPDYQPPCFWSSCAFAQNETNVLHRHPFGKYRDRYVIEDRLSFNSVYTWPFRLSITHDSYKKNGQYFPDLDRRMDRYKSRLETGRSLIFFYLNYDNPISSDEYKYALVGCARLVDVADSGAFPFEPEEFERVRQGDGMKNFPAMNWALKLQHEGAAAGVIMPYHAYLDHVAGHPEDEAKLQEIVNADGTRPCAGLGRRRFRGANGGLASGYRAVKRAS